MTVPVPPRSSALAPDDEAAVTRQLGRAPRGVVGVAHRCPCGQPDVVMTRPRLPDGTPFPTLYYLTCPKAAALIGTLESSGLMRDMEARLAVDPDLAEQYRTAHDAYLDERNAIEPVTELDGISAGGMPIAGEVPARPGRACAGRRPRRQSARRRGGRRTGGMVDGHPMRGGGREHMSRAVAAIDCGTNAIRLLVAEVDADGILHEDVRLMRIVRLGEGIDRTGEFAPEALERTFAAIDEYAEVIRGRDVGRTRFVATSASRDASNRDAFTEGVRRRLGVEPEVITGTEEAALSFAGAVRGLPAGLVTAPALVVDIGGGSTEFVLGVEAPVHSASVDVGCVRMTERHLHDDPPTVEQIAAAWARHRGSRGGRRAAGPLRRGRLPRGPGRLGDDRRGHGPGPARVRRRRPARVGDLG